VGEKIVIASTDYEFEHAEERIIETISGNTITFNEPLKYKHYSAIETYDTKNFNSECEVGLLSRNVKLTGESLSDELKYGGHVMVSGNYFDGTLSRISYVEFEKMG